MYIEKGYLSMQNLLEMKNIVKSFSGVHVLNNVSFSLGYGEVHGLIGGNGAGKSTLMKILNGIYKPDSGEILLEGKKIRIRSTEEATRAGISIIHQEVNLIPNLSICENIFIGREFTNLGLLVDFRKTAEEAEKYTEAVGLNVDVNTLVKDLSLAQRQMVEVAKALSTESKIIVMDEPTSSLTERETKILMDVIRNLRKNGVTVVYISHKLSELFEITDRISVLRDGEFVGTVDTKDCDENRLINMIVGRSINDVYGKHKTEKGDVILKAEHLSAGKMVQDVSFELHKGEILGFAGLVGSGRSEVMRAIFGIDRLESGKVYMDGKVLKNHSPSDTIDAGIGFVPEDRNLLGLILGMNVRENITLPDLDNNNQYSIINKTEETQITDFYVGSMKIKASNIEQQIKTLSGGNQQKIVVAKWLATHPKVLILDEPTRGIDINAKHEIYELMNRLTKDGVGIIMVSSEMSEILGMSDRIMVMYGGKIAEELSREEATQEKIMEIILRAADTEKRK